MSQLAGERKCTLCEGGWHRNVREGRDHGYGHGRGGRRPLLLLLSAFVMVDGILHAAC